MKTLTLTDVVNLLEDTIEDWGDQAKGGDAFASDDLIDEAKWEGDHEVKVELTGFTADQKLPVCLVGTMIHDLGVKGFKPWAISTEVEITEDALTFLDHVIFAVDGQEYGTWANGGFFTPPFKPNPKRDWRLALDRVYAAWGLA